jgi:hypothetical protein
MPKPAVTLETVWQTGLTFSNVEKSTSWGAPALRIDRRDRPALLAESPDLYYAPDHYLGYDGVLVRLKHLTPEILHDLLAMAYKFATRKPGRPLK